MKRTRRGIALLALVALSLYGGLTLAALEPAAHPILRVEAGMHVGSLTDAATDREGRFAVTLGDDHTARIWGLPRGQLLAVLRPPIGQGAPARLTALAMSPDGLRVAVAAGDNDRTVYLFDRASGRIDKRLSAPPGLVRHMAFSPDGRWLAATAAGTPGLMMWDWRADRPALSGIEPGSDGAGLDWTRDNEFVTLSADRQMRLYRVEGGSVKQLAHAPAESGQSPSAMAFSPARQALAVGYADVPRVDVFDAKSLALDWSASAAAAAAADAGSIAVAWNTSGSVLYAAGRVGDDGRAVVRSWSGSGRDEPIAVKTVAGAIVRLVGLPDLAGSGGVFVAGVDVTWGLLDSDGRWQLKQAPPSAIAGHSAESLRLSDDGRDVAFGAGEANGFDVSARRLKAAPAATHDTAEPNDSPPAIGKEPTEWPSAPGSQTQLEPGEIALCSALMPHTGARVIGSDRALRLLDGGGKALWRVTVPLGVQRIGFPSSARLLVAQHGDGSLRWYRLSDGRELLALFVHADYQRWLLWTPSGFYAASPGGENFAGWHIDRGAGLASDFFPLSRLRERLRRPDIVDRVLETLDEASAIADADRARGARFGALDIMRILPPVLELLSPPQVVASQSPIIVRYRIRQTRSTAPSALRVRVDGFAQPEARARELRLTASAELREVAVAVPPRDSHVQLFAQGASGMSNPVGVQVLWRGDSTPDTDRVGTDASTLYVLAVGISDYQHADFRKLTSAADGAQDIVAALQRQQGRPYTRVETRLLTGSQATRDNIADALDWLQQRVTARDLGVLFLAGHALGDSNAGWAFLPVNADPTRLRRTTVSLAELRSALGAAPGRILAILDTSNPGSAFATPLSTPAPDIGRVIDELSSVENGVVVLSADGGEAPVADGGADSGAFAKALIEALDGGAGANGAGTLTLKALGSYMQRRVKQMTEGRQHPLMRAPEGVDDFAIVRTAR